MLSLLRRQPSALSPAEAPQAEPSAHLSSLVNGIAQLASNLGREAAEVRGAVEDTRRAAGLQAQAMQ